MGNLYLVHHGINGQKWGQRNGPPYPLKYEAHSAAEKKANSRSELTGDRKTDETIIKKTYHESKYAKAASVLARSESDRAAKKASKSYGSKSEEQKAKYEHLSKQSKKAEENARYFSDKFQRQASEFAEKYGKNPFKKFKTDFVDNMSTSKASNFIANERISGMVVLGGAIGGGIKGYQNYKEYQNYINRL